MSPDYVATVVFSGLLIVFVALFILILAVSLMGKIFDLIAAKKQPAKIAPPDIPAPVRSAAPAVPAEVPAPLSDDDEVIAVIAAAVAQISAETGRQLRIRSVKPARTGGRSAWASAAVLDSMRSI